jgi:hypothetical protein
MQSFKRHIWDFSNINIAQLNEELSNLNWENCERDNNRIDDAYKNWFDNRWEICLSMREQNEPRNCVEYTQRVITKRRNCVSIAKCLVQNKLLFYVENGHDIN